MKGAIVGAIAGIVVGVGTMIPAWQAGEYQREQLEIQKQQLVLDKERAEREREKARKDLIVAMADVERYRRNYEEAAKKFTAKLGDLINKAAARAESKENQSDVVTAAKTLVAARNDAARSLESLGAALDSEIDLLQRELLAKSPNVPKIVELIRVLQGKWDIKKAEIELRVRKMQVELGLVLEQNDPPPPLPPGPSR